MIGFNGDDPLDPNAKKSLIDQLSGGPVDPLGAPSGASPGGYGITDPAPMPGPEAAAPPSPATTGNDVYGRNYRDSSSINGRTDNDGKTEYSRFRQAIGHAPSDDDIRSYVNAHPDEWEMKTDPQKGLVFRQKQSYLNDPANGDSKTGANSTWQTKDFTNAYDSDNEQQAQLPGQSGAGAFGYLNPMIAGNPMPNIQAALSTVQQPGLIQDLIKRLQTGG